MREQGGRRRAQAASMASSATGVIIPMPKKPWIMPS